MYGRIKSYINVNDSDDDSNMELNNSKSNNNDENITADKANKANDYEYDYDKNAFLKMKEKQEKIKLEKKKNDEVNNTTLSLKEEIINKNKKYNKNNKIDNGKTMVEVQYCGLCDKRVNSKLEFDIHTASKKHLEKLRKNTLEKLSKFDSVKSFLVENGIISRKNSNSNRLKQLLYTISLDNLINR